MKFVSNMAVLTGGSDSIFSSRKHLKPTPTTYLALDAKHKGNYWWCCFTKIIALGQ